MTGLPGTAHFAPRPAQKDGRELLLDDLVQDPLLPVQLTLVALDLQMGRSRRAGRGGPESMSQHVGQPRDVIGRAVEFRHLLESGQVVDFLVDLAVLGRREPAAGQGDDRRPGQERLAQARGQVHGADGLRGADARPAAGPRVPIRHVDGRLLAVRGKPCSISATAVAPSCCFPCVLLTRQFSVLAAMSDIARMQARRAGQPPGWRASGWRTSRPRFPGQRMGVHSASSWSQRGVPIIRTI
jgi:hypothetical protein